MRLHCTTTLPSSLQSQLSVNWVCYLIDLADLQVVASYNAQVQYSRAESYATTPETEPLPQPQKMLLPERYTLLGHMTDDVCY